MAEVSEPLAGTVDVMEPRNRAYFAAHLLDVADTNGRMYAVRCVCFARGEGRHGLEHHGLFSDGGKTDAISFFY